MLAFSPFGYIPRSRTAGLYSNSMFNPLRNLEFVVVVVIKDIIGETGQYKVYRLNNSIVSAS